MQGDSGVASTTQCSECDSLQAEFSKGKSQPELTTQGKILLTITGTAFGLVFAVTTPFILPALRKICLPYVPATTDQVKNILHLLQGKRGHLIDLGSGDGRIVIEAAKLGLCCDGVELNPWLVWYSRFSSFRQGTHRRTSFYRKDLWKTDLSKYNYVIIFGVDCMMKDLTDKLRRDLCEQSEMIGCRLVTFDIVNTVLRVIGSPALQYADIARQHGLLVDPQKIASVYRPLYVQMKKEYPQYGIHSEMSTKQWWNVFVRRVISATGHTADERVLTKITDSLWERFSEGANWEVLPHTAGVLQQLKERGFIVAAVSNFDERLENTLRKQNLLSYFDFCVTVVSARAEKPDPHIFLAALSNVPVKPTEALHVGDDVKNDYLAARSVGMHAFLFDVGAKLTTNLDRNGINKEDILTDIRQLPLRVSLL